MIKEIHILTIFEEMFKSPFDYSIVKRAQYNSLIKIYVHNLRKWTNNNYQTVDGHPFGGGPGMVMMIEPIYKALKEIKATLVGNTHIVLTSAKGQQFTQQKAVNFTNFDNLIIVCGHYEGVDERVAQHLIDEEVSIGKYVLSGGEIPAMVITDAIVRLIPGAVGNEDSLSDESFNEEDTLEYPHFTRPAEFITDEGEKWVVPDVLLNGNHKEIEKWKDSQKQKLN
jgi:tRNA (guanine37-N1)-methyltransferase